MGRRGRISSPISLFSFQDIVTSVTAIIILMTLLLAVELIHRKVSRAAAAPLSTAPLKAAIAQAASEIGNLQKTLEQGAGESVEQAAVTTESLPREIVEIQRQAAALRRELETLRRQETAAQKEMQTVLAQSFERRTEHQQVAQIESQTAGVQQSIVVQSRENAKQLRRREELDQRRREGKRPGERRIYNRPPGVDKLPWLVEVDENVLRVAPLGRKQKPEEFTGSAFQSPADQFAAWAKSRSTATDYFVLLARPQGIEVLNSLIDKLETRGFDLGFDVIGPEEAVLDPNSGAADDVP